MHVSRSNPVSPCALGAHRPDCTPPPRSYYPFLRCPLVTHAPRHLESGRIDLSDCFVVGAIFLRVGVVLAAEKPKVAYVFQAELAGLCAVREFDAEEVCTINIVEMERWASIDCFGGDFHVAKFEVAHVPGVDTSCR